jgi:inhibitor of KinA sporulation pathway (predicted exonuclease)
MADTPLILVIDLEATCADDRSIASTEMEIIEIGAVWATPESTVLDRFQTFVRPLERPQLTAFCIDLIGIEQGDVDTAPLFPTAAHALRQFVDKHQRPGAFWTSWGAYDFNQIERDCHRHQIANPIPLPHENAKRLFAKRQRTGKAVGMTKACDLVDLRIEGRHHRALDDALNIARLLPWIYGDRRRPSRTSPSTALPGD